MISLVLKGKLLDQPWKNYTLQVDEQQVITGKVGDTVTVTLTSIDAVEVETR